MFFSYIEEVAHTPKLVITKKRIDPVRLPREIFKREAFFLRKYPIPAIKMKLPYTKGIVAWRPRNRSETTIATRGSINPPQGIITPEKRAKAAIGDTFGIWGIRRIKTALNTTAEKAR